MTIMMHEIKNYALSILVDEQGGEVKSLKDRSGREYIWQGHPESWGGCSPVLFPICGSLRNNQALLANGKSAVLNRHGFARKMMYQCEFANEGKAQFQLSSNEDTLAAYLYPFTLTIQMVGDRKFDIMAAEDNNLPFIGCAYGYAPKEIRGADIVIEHPRELPATVTALLT